MWKQRIGTLLDKDEESNKNYQYFLIDANEFKIIDIIGHRVKLPKDTLLGKQIETFVPNNMIAELCKQTITCVCSNGVPKSMTVPLKFEGRTINGKVHFKRGNRRNDNNTVIAYID